MKNIIESEFIPKRQTTFSAGYDIYAVEDMVIPDSYYKVYDTGIILDNECIYNSFHQVVNPKSNKMLSRINFYQHYVAMVFPRSSMGFKHGLHFANTVCIIDQDYKDTIKIALKADHYFNIKKGERYAQLVFVPIGLTLNEIRPTEIRKGGVGSTDIKPIKTLEEFNELS